MFNHKNKIDLTFLKMDTNLKSLHLSVEEVDAMFKQLRIVSGKKAKEKAAKDISAKSGHRISIANRYFEKIELNRKRISTMTDLTALSLNGFELEVKKA
jgi:prophage maintenance system killer protein